MAAKQKRTARTTAFLTDETAKFRLFLKTREVQQLAESLQKVRTLPKLERERWIKEHGEFVAEEFEAFINDSNLTFEGLSMDDETLELSRDLVLSLKEALATVQGMLNTSYELES